MIDPSKYGTDTEAARAAGVKRTTLVTAIERGDEIETHRTHGGTRLVCIAAAKRWAKKSRKPGRKPQGKS